MSTETVDPYVAMWWRYEWQDDLDYSRMLDDERARTARCQDTMRGLLDVIDATSMPMPDVVLEYRADVQWVARWWANDVEVARLLRRALAAKVDGPWEKETRDGTMRLHTVHDGVQYVVLISGVCEQVVVGQEEATVDVEVCPVCDSDLDRLGSGHTVCTDDGCDYEVRPPKRTTRTVLQDRVEWRCPDLNGGDAA